MSASGLSDFGQQVDLTSRIREILRGYPEGTPLLKELLGSPHDEYVITAMQVLQIILQSFGPLISQTRLASANQSFVDIQVSPSVTRLVSHTD